MKNSIRYQFAAIFIVLFAAVILIIGMINTLFLQRYYINNMQKALETSFVRFNELYKEHVDVESEEYNIEFEGICNTNNLSVVLVDSSFNVIKTSVGYDDKLAMRLLSYILKDDPNYISEMKESAEKNDAVSANKPPRDDKKAPEEKTLLTEAKDYSISVSTDKRMGTDYIELVGYLGSDYMIFIRTPLESIKESVKITNGFLIKIGLFALIFGTILIMIVTNRITKPILELASISKRMAQLDFEAKYNGDSDNEIGYLGAHMNELSGTLEQTISELKTANNELKVDLEKRERLDEMKSEFVSSVSHELKTPIAIIQGYAEGLKEEVNDDPESREYYCDVIADEADKMNRMVKNLLTLNQLEFGYDIASMERFNIKELIDNFLKYTGVVLKDKNVTVEVDAPDSLYVWGDEFKVEEVLSNYFSNAVHYVSDGGVISIKAVKIGDKCNISVYNTGDAIPQEAIEHIWDKFYKVDKARTREYGGSGVGLSIVKAIMDSFGQKFGVENIDLGVRFWFELDCK